MSIYVCFFKLTIGDDKWLDRISAKHLHIGHQYLFYDMAISVCLTDLPSIVFRLYYMLYACIFALLYRVLRNVIIKLLLDHRAD